MQTCASRRSVCHAPVIQVVIFALISAPKHRCIGLAAISRRGIDREEPSWRRAYDSGGQGQCLSHGDRGAGTQKGAEAPFGGLVARVADQSRYVTGSTLS